MLSLPPVTLLLSADQLLAATLLSQGQGTQFLVGTRALTECHPGQLALNRPGLLPREFATPELAGAVLKTRFYLKANSWQTVAPPLRFGTSEAGTQPNTCK